MRAFLILMCCASAARAERACEPSPEVQSEIVSSPGRPDADERLKRLLDAHPDDVFVNEAWADQASMTDYAAIRDHYRVLHEREPNEPRWTYLYARMVSYASAREALELTRDIDHPRAHLLRAGRFSRAKDPVSAKKELARYQAACPDALEGWPLRLKLAGEKDKPLELAQLRRQLAGRSDRAAIAAYGTLWKAEFQAAAPPRHPALRRQVAADLVRMRAAMKSPDAALVRVLDEGYKITSNADGQAWVKTLSDAGSHAFMETFQAWLKEHPAPGDGAPKAEREAWGNAQYAASAEWVKQYPSEKNAWEIRLAAAPRALPVAELKAIAAKLLALDDASVEVAATYAARGIDLDEVPAMVQRSLERNERRWASMRAQPDRFTQMASMLDDEEKSARLSAWSTLSRVFLAQKDASKVRDVVGKIKAIVAKEKPDDEMHKYHQASYWSARARLALCEKKKADALGYLVKAQALDGDDDDARDLWKELGGSEDGWTALTAAAAAARSNDQGWTQKQIALPAMSLTDLAGKQWKSTDLKGKTVVLVTWATWCVPCKAELPHLEKLYQQIKKRTDVIVASLNVDFDVGVVEPFIKENKYSFPVLLSGEWANDLRGEGIPLGWIADRTFTVRLERLGYDGSATWAEDTLAAIERIAKR